jgi:dipeptidyl-peptidase-4
MQHSLAFVQKCVEEGVQIDFFPYPMHPHNVSGKDRVHLMTKVLNYIIENNK